MNPFAYIRQSMGSMSLTSASIHAADIQQASDQRGKIETSYKLINTKAVTHQSLRSLENAMVDRITLHVAGLAKGTSYLRRHDCFYKRGSHMGLSALVKTMVRETNIRLGDYNGWDSTGVRCAVLAVEYLSRASPYIVINYVQSFFVTAFMLAFKLNDDESLPNTFFSGLGGFSLADLNNMEMEFCEMIKWRLAISLHGYVHLRQLLLPL